MKTFTIILCGYCGVWTIFGPLLVLKFLGIPSPPFTIFKFLASTALATVLVALHLGIILSVIAAHSPHGPLTDTNDTDDTR